MATFCGLRRHAAFAVLFVLATGIYLALTWSGQLGSIDGDSSVYLLTARHYAPYVPADPLLAPVAANSPYPPLFPLLLAASYGAADLRFAHAATTACLLGSFVLFYLWLQSAGLSRGLATAAVAAFAIIPGTWLQATFILSESLYLLLSLACLLALSRAQLKGDAGRWWAAVLAAAALLLTRSAGVAMLPALAWVLWRARPRGGWLMLLCALLPALTWAVLHRSGASYSSDLVKHLQGEMGTVAGLFAQLAVGARAIGRGVAGNLTDPASLLPFVALLGAAAAVVAMRRFAGGCADAGYVLAYLGLIVVWPYPGEALRFAWLLMPFLIAYVFIGAVDLAGRLRSFPALLRGALAWSPAPVLALLTLPGLVVAAGRYVQAADYPHPQVRHLAEWYGYDPVLAWEEAEIHLGLVNGIRELSAEVPPGECVYAIKSALVIQLGERSSFPPPAEALDDAAFEEALAARGCRYFLLLAKNSPTFKTNYYPQQRLAERLDILGARLQPNGSGEVLVALARLGP